MNTSCYWVGWLLSTNFLPQLKALAEKKKVVPYRDSVLTKLLQNALGGNRYRAPCMLRCCEKCVVSITVLNAMLMAWTQHDGEAVCLVWVKFTIQYRKLYPLSSRYSRCENVDSRLSCLTALAPQIQILVGCDEDCNGFQLNSRASFMYQLSSALSFHLPPLPLSPTPFARNY